MGHWPQIGSDQPEWVVSGWPLRASCRPFGPALGARQKPKLATVTVAGYDWQKSSTHDNLAGGEAQLAKAPFKHGRKLCVFCGNPANSGEHIWPKWAHDLIPEASGHKQVVFEGPITRDIMSRVYDRDRQGSVAKVAIKRVCKACNNGWMSDYEGKAKAMLRAMMTGRHLALGADSQRLLAEYFTLKLMVLDWTAADPIFSQEERTAFFDGRVIPAGVQLIIAFCPDRRMSSYYRTHFQEASDVSQLAQHQPGRNVKTFAVGFCGIFLFALCIKDDAADLKLEPRQSWFQLRPAKLPLIYWPPFLAISRDEAETVASSLGALKKHARVKVADNVVGAISTISGKFAEYLGPPVESG